MFDDSFLPFYLSSVRRKKVTDSFSINRPRLLYACEVVTLCVQIQKRRKIEAEFSGGEITADGGPLRAGLTRTCFTFTTSWQSSPRIRMACIYKNR